MRIVIVSVLLSLALFLHYVESSVNVEPHNYYHNEAMMPSIVPHNRRPSRFEPIGPRPPINPEATRHFNPNRPLYPLPPPPARGRVYQSDSQREDITQIQNSGSHVQQSNSPARRLTKTKSKGGSLLCCGGF